MGITLKLHKKGQATLEMSLAVIAVFFIIIATGRIFIWFVNQSIERQVRFQTTRISGLGKAFDYIPPFLRVLAPEEDRDDLPYSFADFSRTVVTENLNNSFNNVDENNTLLWPE